MYLLVYMYVRIYIIIHVQCTYMYVRIYTCVQNIRDCALYYVGQIYTRVTPEDMYKDGKFHASEKVCLHMFLEIAVLSFLKRVSCLFLLHVLHTLHGHMYMYLKVIIVCE